MKNKQNKKITEGGSRVSSGRKNNKERKGVIDFSFKIIIELLIVAVIIYFAWVVLHSVTSSFFAPDTNSYNEFDEWSVILQTMKETTNDRVERHLLPFKINDDGLEDFKGTIIYLNRKDPSSILLFSKNIYYHHLASSSERKKIYKYFDDDCSENNCICFSKASYTTSKSDDYNTYNKIEDILNKITECRSMSEELRLTTNDETISCINENDGCEKLNIKKDSYPLIIFDLKIKPQGSDNIKVVVVTVGSTKESTK